MALMVKKCTVVKEAVELKSMLTNVSFPDTSEVLLRSDQYIQVGCDLRDLSRLSAVLASAVDVLDLRKCEILFTAEVSITYMDTDAADDLIRWAIALPHSTCIPVSAILGSNFAVKRAFVSSSKYYLMGQIILLLKLC
jgi:tRNA wybutosine-synthesizing protein 4